MGGFPALQTFLRGFRARAQQEGGACFYFDCGDVFQGTPVVDHHRGACMIGLLNEVGAAGAALGNHEFDYGLDRLGTLSEEAQYPLICANIVWKSSGRRPEFLVPMHMFKAGDIDIAVIGILTPETMNITSPRNVEAIEILDPLPIVNALALQAREAGARFVILLSHCGLEGDIAMTDNMFGVDLILGGHSHSPMDAPLFRGPGRIPIVHPGANLTHVNEIIIDIAPGMEPASLTFRQVPLYLEEWPEDPHVKAMVASFETGIADLKRVLGTAAIELNRGVIGGDSPQGSWVADAMREVASADFAFINFGGLRRPIFEGTITEEDLFQLQPFDNAIDVLQMTGSQVIDLVERSLSPNFLPIDEGARNVTIRLFRLDGTGLRREIEGYGYLLPSNLKVTFDPERPAMSRIVTITDGAGAPLDLTREYRVALNSYMSEGGDGFTHLMKHTKRQATGIQVRDAVIRKTERDGGIPTKPDPRMFNLKLKVAPYQEAPPP